MTATDTPTLFSRDPITGLETGRTYPRLPNGKIDWRALLNPAHITFNSKNERIAAEIEKAYGAPAKSLVYADVAAKQTVEDKHILVLLAGFQELAELRGYSSSIPTSVTIGRSLRKRSPDVSYRDIEDTIVSASWIIEWIANEEEPNGKTSGGTADATYENTGDFGYLSAMAGNRAFVRAVKNGLGIRILGFDEIAKKDDALPEAGQANGSLSSAGSSSSSFSSVGQPVPSLIKWASEGGFSFEAVKKSAVKRWHDETVLIAKDATFARNIKMDPSTWKSFEDVPAGDCLTLIGAIRKTIAAKVEGK